ncbi:MAG: hypothetical protein F4Y86_04000, partial [Gammaproteobacteria bacterium]|nr:hypothetical protein [Gammaproteobacteria bacterium]
MTRVQLIIPDDDHLNYVRQAQREELTLSAWLRAAAQDRLQRMRRTARFETQADVRSFFAECDRIETLGLVGESGCGKSVTAL